MRADEIPVAHTPPGGYGRQLPPPVLDGCTEELPPGAPDLRGLWEVSALDWRGPGQPPQRLMHHRQRIEQCGDRLVVTAAGVIHDMRCDGSVEHGVHDVAEADFTTPISVVASYEDGVHVLRPVGAPELTVTRRRDGSSLVWEYGTRFVARLERVAS